MATAAFRAHRLDTALHYALLGESYANSSDLESDDYKDIVWLLSDIHAARGDWGKAHLYDRQYIALQDTINHRRHMRAMAEAETRFDLVEKNKQLAILSKENELQKVRSQKQRTVNALLFVGLLIGSLAGLVVVRVYRRTMKQNTLLYEQKKIIDDQVAQLAVAAGMKSRFFANISHELRTPVTLLTGMLELLKEKPADTNKEKQTLEIAHANSVRLQHMIEEILDLARQESQPDVQTRIHIKELSPLLVRIVAAFETHIHNKDLHLQYGGG
jgi:signal transduction histidine kinase